MRQEAVSEVACESRITRPTTIFELRTALIVAHVLTNTSAVVNLCIGIMKYFRSFYLELKS
jgi:hypothetical protein